MKLLFLIRQTLATFIITTSVLAQSEQFPTKLTWSRLQSFPESFSFEGEITGYLSIFRTAGAWHVYLYRSREALKDHHENAFVKLDYIQFGNILKIEEFSGNEKLLKSLDQRFVRVAGVFRTAEDTISEVSFFSDKIVSMYWRGKDGKWTSDQKEGLHESPLKEGRSLSFPDAVFFKHESKDE